MAVPPLRFDSAYPEKWGNFFRRIRQHVASKGNISDEQKKGIILDALDDPTLDRLERWLEPITLEAAAYFDVVDSLEFNLRHQVNCTVQYIQFTQRKQQPGESALAYSEALSVLAATMGFDDRPVRDRLVMYQFVAGVCDPALQERLLDLADSTLSRVIDTATQHEATRRSAAAARAEAEGVFKVMSASGQASQGSKPFCYYCAGPHLANACTADRSRFYCSACGVKGHISKACQGGTRTKKSRKKAKEETLGRQSAESSSDEPPDRDDHERCMHPEASGFIGEQPLVGEHPQAKATVWDNWNLFG